MAATVPKTYPGQDNRQTSTKEVLAWYSYCFASEVYAVVALSMLLEPHIFNDSHLYPCHTRTTRLRTRSVILRPYYPLSTP
jgi:hypothetical protein